MAAGVYAQLPPPRKPLLSQTGGRAGQYSQDPSHAPSKGSKQAQGPAKSQGLPVASLVAPPQGRQRQNKGCTETAGDVQIRFVGSSDAYCTVWLVVAQLWESC